jgi:hypothetical protein
MLDSGSRPGRTEVALRSRPRPSGRRRRVRYPSICIVETCTKIPPGASSSAAATTLQPSSSLYRSTVARVRLAWGSSKRRRTSCRRAGPQLTRLRYVVPARLRRQARTRRRTPRPRAEGVSRPLSRASNGPSTRNSIIPNLLRERIDGNTVRRRSGNARPRVPPASRPIPAESHQAK